MAPNSQILTVVQMQAAEQVLIDGGETVETLMETAGNGAAEWIWRVAAGRSVTVLCGPGNNGGDGYVIARVLRQRGLEVSVMAPIEPKSDAAIANAERWGTAPVDGACGEIFVDCLFGSGLQRPLSNELADLVRSLARKHAYRVAIDLPSGIESDSGAPLNEGLPRYDLTISLGAWKYAHWLMPAMGAMEERRLVDIGVDEVEDAAHIISPPKLSAPTLDSHKYTRGLMVVIGGAMPGAGVLAAKAGMYGGAGYVKLFADHKSPSTPDDLVVDDAPLDEALADDRINALLVGPGLGRDELAKVRLSSALARDIPTVCDGDGLVLLEPGQLERRDAALILTPHEGELSTLHNRFNVDDGDRRARVTELARTTGAIIVAKGPDTLVVAPDGRIAIRAPAPSWLSVAGTGDVLAGLVASRLAIGVAPFDAACEAVWLHGDAARRSGAVFTAGDLIRALPETFAARL